MCYNSKYKGRISGVCIRVIETGEVFETRTSCAEALNVSVGMVSMALSGKVKSCRGYHLEAIDMETVYHLTDEVISELYEITREECEWRVHPSRMNIYVSDTGLVAKNTYRGIEIRRQHLQNSGYLVVSIGNKNDLNSNALVHRLVAETFIPNRYPETRRCVNHIDGDKLNNHVTNLEWCSYSENMRHAFDNGLYSTDRVLLVETGEIFESASKCARAINGTVSGIHDCKSGRQKQHRGYHFIFLGDEKDV